MFVYTFARHRVFEVSFMLISGFLPASLLPADSWTEETGVQLVPVSLGRFQYKG